MSLSCRGKSGGGGLFQYVYVTLCTQVSDSYGANGSAGLLIKVQLLICHLCINPVFSTFFFFFLSSCSVYIPSAHILRNIRCQVCFTYSSLCLVQRDIILKQRTIKKVFALFRRKLKPPANISAENLSRHHALSRKSERQTIWP